MYIAWKKYNIKFVQYLKSLYINWLVFVMETVSVYNWKFKY
jgi:hypothetical protein